MKTYQGKDTKPQQAAIHQTQDNTMGGAARFVDNRPASVFQRKMRAMINARVKEKTLPSGVPSNTIQRKIMSADELMDVGESNEPIEPTQKYLALIQKVREFHAASRETKKKKILNQIITLSEAWSKINAIKEKSRQRALVGRLTKQAYEELRITSDEPTLVDVKMSKNTSQTPVYIPVNEPLFKEGEPKIEDVTQGALGDCYLVAVIGSLVAANPDFIKNIMYDGGDAVTVLLYENGKSKYIKVPKTVPHISVGEGKNKRLVHAYARGVLWVQILEKAVATLFGGYDKVVGGTSDVAIHALTGRHENKILTNVVKLEETTMEMSRFLWPEKLKVPEDDWFGEADNIEKDIKNKRILYRKVFGKQAPAWQDFVEDETHHSMLAKFNKLDQFEAYFVQHVKDKKLAVRAADYLITNKLFAGKLGSGRYSQKQLDLFERISDAAARGMAINASTKPNPMHGSQEAGLYSDHEYTVLQVKEQGELKYIQIRNPHGRTAREYVRDKLTGDLQPQKAESDDSGRAWIELSDFADNFKNAAFADLSRKEKIPAEKENPEAEHTPTEAFTPLMDSMRTTTVAIQGGKKAAVNIPPEALSLKTAPNDGQGDCFYHAVYMALHNVDASNKDNQAQIRQTIANAVHNNVAILPNYFVSQEQVDHFIQEVQASGGWVPDAGPHIAAGALGSRIHVYDIQGERTLIFTPDNPTGRDIHLNYLGGNHYEAYIKISLKKWAYQKVMGWVDGMSEMYNKMESPF